MDTLDQYLGRQRLWDLFHECGNFLHKENQRPRSTDFIGSKSLKMDDVDITTLSVVDCCSYINQFPQVPYNLDFITVIVNRIHKLSSIQVALTPDPDDKPADQDEVRYAMKKKQSGTKQSASNPFGSATENWSTQEEQETETLNKLIDEYDPDAPVQSFVGSINQIDLMETMDAICFLIIRLSDQNINKVKYFTPDYLQKLRDLRDDILLPVTQDLAQQTQKFFEFHKSAGYAI